MSRLPVLNLCLMLLSALLTACGGGGGGTPAPPGSTAVASCVGPAVAGTFIVEISTVGESKSAVELEVQEAADDNALRLNGRVRRLLTEFEGVHGFSIEIGAEFEPEDLFDDDRVLFVEPDGQVFVDALPVGRTVALPQQEIPPGMAIDLSAPGFDILSSWPGGLYQVQSGTSMAVPQVAGAAALYIAARDNDINLDGLRNRAAVLAIRQALINGGQPQSQWRPSGTGDPDLNPEPLVDASGN